MNVFVTFSSTGYEWAKDRICKEALDSGYFDKTIAINESQLTPELLNSQTFHTKRGYGLYSWKPDTIFQALNQCSEGDIVVYCDAGCTITRANEWYTIFKFLDTYDILGFRLRQRNFRWTRNSVFKHFASDIHFNWKDDFQIGANFLVVKNNENGRKFINEWRKIMISRLDLCGDITPEEKYTEDTRLVKNQCDQTILTALMYKYEELGAATSIWEHFEGKDPFKGQAIRASRLRKEGDPDLSVGISGIVKMVVKTYFYFPLIAGIIRKRNKASMNII